MNGKVSSIYVPGNLVAVCAAASVLFFICMAAGFLVLNKATLEADNFSIASERKLVAAELSHFVERVTIEQGELSYWDDSKTNLVLSSPPDATFVRENIVDWLIGEHGFSAVTLVKADDTILLSATDGQFKTDNPDTTLFEIGRDLVQSAREQYVEKRIEVGGRYMVYAEAGEILPEIQAHAYRYLDGVPNLIVAQVMLTEEPQYASRDNEEVVFLSAKPLTDKVVLGLASRLGLGAAEIKDADELLPSEQATSVAMPDMGDQSSLRITWEPQSPRESILQAMRPLIVALMMTLLAILFFIVHRYAAALKTLTASEATNRFLADHDSLTGLPNRKKFEESLESAFAIVAQQRFSVMYIDLDRFKAVNDSYGHAAGDAVLIDIAKRLNAVIGTKGTVSRVGGDEFVALITTELTDNELQQLAKEVIADVEKPISFDAVQLKVGASIGMAVAPKNGSTPRSIMKSADAALYASKENGRGQAGFWKNAA